MTPSVVRNAIEKGLREGWDPTRSGAPFRLATPSVACPCCGQRTLQERGCFEICSECDWEDDGQDDSDADVVRGGPNGDLSLAQARVRYRQSKAAGAQRRLIARFDGEDSGAGPSSLLVYELGDVIEIVTTERHGGDSRICVARERMPELLRILTVALAQRESVDESGEGDAPGD